MEKKNFFIFNKKERHPMNKIMTYQMPTAPKGIDAADYDGSGHGLGMYELG